MEAQADKLLGFAGETDRIYYKTPAELTLLDVGAAGRHRKLLKMGFPDAVTWNIGEAKSVGLKDMGILHEVLARGCGDAPVVGMPTLSATLASARSHAANFVRAARLRRAGR